MLSSNHTESILIYLTWVHYLIEIIKYTIYGAEFRYVIKIWMHVLSGHIGFSLLKYLISIFYAFSVTVGWKWHFIIILIFLTF